MERLVREKCKLSVGQRWKLMATKQQPQVSYITASLGRSQAGNLATNIRVVQVARSDRGHLILCNLLVEF